MRFNLGECCDGEDLAGVYTYDTYGQAAPQAQSPSGMYTYSGSGPLPQSRIIEQIRPVQSPVIPQQLMPAPTTMGMPGMVATAQFTSPDNTGAGSELTPRNLLKPLPTIVDNQPTQIAQCNSFSEWVDQNPLLAGGLLLGFAWVMLGKKG